ncbi:MAG: hypothetical protein AAF193_06660, partial [Bacteroidota bacterium]
MKKYLTLPTLFIVLALVSCKKDEEPEAAPGNRAPSPFDVVIAAQENQAALLWNAVDPDGDPLIYTVILEDDTVATELEDAEYTLENLNYDQTYHGMVIAEDPDGLQRSSEYQFTTGIFPNEPPFPFDIISPVLGANLVSLTPSLNWGAAVDPDGDPVSYSIYLDTSPNPTTLIAENINNTTYGLTQELSHETLYYWKIVATDPYQATTETSVGSFTTLASVQGTLLVDNPGWDARGGHKVLNFNGKIYVIGGETCCGGRFNDVWSSPDGVNWTLETDNAPWAGRSQFGATVFDGKMWITGGNSSYTPGNEFNDLWSSTDGANWTLENSNPAYNPRYGMEMASFGGNMYVLGGRNAENSFSRYQIWRSNNGQDWEMVYDDNDFVLTPTQFVTTDDAIYRIAGYDEKMYMSNDAINWTLVTDDIGCGSRYNHSCTIHEGRFYLMSGNTNNGNNYEFPDVYYSDDGVNWVLAAEDAGYV